MKTRKDVVFAIVCVVWVLFAGAMFVKYGPSGTTIAHLIMCTIMVVLILLKNHTKLGTWLETPLKND